MTSRTSQTGLTLVSMAIVVAALGVQVELLDVFNREGLPVPAESESHLQQAAQNIALSNGMKCVSIHICSSAFLSHEPPGAVASYICSASSNGYYRTMQQSFTNTSWPCVNATAQGDWKSFYYPNAIPPASVHWLPNSSPTFGKSLALCRGAQTNYVSVRAPWDEYNARIALRLVTEWADRDGGHHDLNKNDLRSIGAEGGRPDMLGLSAGFNVNGVVQWCVLTGSVNRLHYAGKLFFD